jgi:hypothetical protein
MMQKQEAKKLYKESWCLYIPALPNSRGQNFEPLLA